MNGYPRITHCLFDLDGLLLDTTPLFMQANQAVLKDYNREFDAEINFKMAGMCAHEAITVVLESLDLTQEMTVQDYKQKADAHLLRLLPTAKMLPGVERLLRHLHKHKIPMAICTGSHHTTFDLKMRDYGWMLELFEHCVLADSDPEVKKGKPAPDVFVIGMQRFTDAPRSPSNVLVFEDAPNGVAAALAAQMPVVMVPDQRLPKHKTTDATVCLRSLLEFAPEMFGLPPFDDC